MAKLKALDSLLKPRSVAIVGASENPLRLPGMSLNYMKQSGFKGDLWPVNPTRETVQGLKAYASVGDLPAPPDVAIIATPAHLVTQAVKDCAVLGVGAVVIFAVGFSEVGEEGRKAEQELAQIARSAGMRMLGPNCLGCFNSATGYYGTISISLASGLPEAGNVAVVSQSGAYGEQVSYLLKERGVGVRYLVTTGNETDVDVGAALDWMAEQADVNVIVAYAEGPGDPERFVAALARARAANQQIVFMKVGQSSAGVAAAMSHTASMAGDDRVWDAVLRKYGVYRAVSTEEQVDIAYAASRGILPAGRSLGILTVSGGFGIQLCDAAAGFGLLVNPLEDKIAEKLHELLPFGSIANPVDASGQIVGELDRLKASLACLSLEAGYDAIVAILGSVPLGPGMGPPLIEALLDLAKELQDRLVLLCCVADSDTVRMLESAGYLVFADGVQAARAVAALADLAEGKRGRAVASAATLPEPNVDCSKLSEFDAKKMLREAGVPVLAERLARSADQAVAAAEEIGYPVVLKICSAEIQHKTEIGGILLSVSDPHAVREGYAKLVERARDAGYSDEAIDGVLVASMAPAGVETILGIQVDPTFGPAVLFGLGGVYVEVMQDNVLRMAPVDEAEAHAMIREISGFPLLDGVRGAEPSDIDALAQALVALSRFGAANAATLSTIDVNPFVVFEEGRGAAALDALIVGKD